MAEIQASKSGRPPLRQTIDGVEYITLPESRIDQMQEKANDAYTQTEVDEAWAKGAAVAKRELLEKVLLALDEGAWSYREKDQDELEKIAVKIDEASDLVSEAVEQLNRVLDRIRTGR